MPKMCSTPDCDREVTYATAGLCARCYKRQWWRDNVQDKTIVPYAERVDPLSYAAAHMKVRKHRGRARDQECYEQCGAMAQEWAYRNESPHEQVGTKTLNFGGKSYTTKARWSPYIWDYDPLCRSCHYKRDGRTS